MPLKGFEYWALPGALALAWIGENVLRAFGL